MSAKADCIREANERLKEEIEDANDASMICVREFLFFCVESKLDKELFDRLKSAAEKAHDADLQECEEKQ